MRLRSSLLVPLAILAVGDAAPVVGQAVVPLAAFDSVELRSGGEVTIRPGDVARVEVVGGNRDLVRLTVEGGRLVIENCRHRCPDRHRLKVEIVSPGLTGVSVNDGGWIRSEGRFPRRSELRAVVANGGMLDVRSMPADTVLASVAQGGAILTRAEARLDARIEQGGSITYWGDPNVRSSVRHGGAIQRGAAADAERPLAGPRPPLPPVPPLPHVNRH